MSFVVTLKKVLSSVSVMKNPSGCPWPQNPKTPKPQNPVRGEVIWKYFSSIELLIVRCDNSYASFIIDFWSKIGFVSLFTWSFCFSSPWSRHAFSSFERISLSDSRFVGFAFVWLLLFSSRETGFYFGRFSTTIFCFLTSWCLFSVSENFLWRFRGRERSSD